MSRVPKLGTVKLELPVTAPPAAVALTKAADSLAAQSRILRRAAGEVAAHDAGLARLHTVGEDAAAAVAADRAARAARTREVLAPVVEQARAQMETNQKAVREARPLVQELDALDWPAIRARFPHGHNTVPGSEDSTSTRIAWIVRLIDELKPLLGSTDTDLTKALQGAETAIELGIGIESPKGKNALEELKFRLQAGAGREEFIRVKMTALKRRLAEIGEGEIVSAERDTAGAEGN